MAKRLITLQTIQREKLDRSRSWILARRDFPKPAIPGNPNLWDEAAVDAWLEKFVGLELNKRSATAILEESREFPEISSVRSDAFRLPFFSLSTASTTAPVEPVT